MSHVDQPPSTTGTASEVETTGKTSLSPPIPQELNQYRSIAGVGTVITTKAAGAVDSSAEYHSKDVFEKSDGVLQPFTNLPDFNNPDYFIINWVGQTNFLQSLPYGLYMMAFFARPPHSPMQAINLDRVEITVLGRQTGEAVTIDGNVCHWHFTSRGDVDDFHQLSISAWKWVDAPVGPALPPAHELFYKLLGPA